MRKLFIVIVIFISFSSMLYSQNNTVKNKATTKNQTFLENGYKIISFTIININSETDKQLIINDLSNNPNIKELEISDHNQFFAYVKEDYLNQLKIYMHNNNYKTTMDSNKPLGPIVGTQVIVIPDDMKPKYIDTGNPEEDKKRYTEAKQKLLEEHPEFIQK